MRMHADIRPVTHMKTRAAKLLAAVEETRRPVVITQRGRPKGVLLDITTYEELRDATLLLKLIAQGEADEQGDRTLPQDAVFAELKERLTRR